MSMDTFLAQYYGNDGGEKLAAAATTEDVEKQASVELFMKLAQDQNIDLGAMKQNEVNELYNKWKTAAAVGTKTAEEEEKEEHEKKKDLEEKAKKEHEEKKAESEKIAEADFLGRVMAHSFARESREIVKAAAESAAEPALDKEANKVRDAQAGYTAAKSVGHVAGDALKKGLDHVKSHAAGAAKSVGEHATNAGAAIHHAAHGAGPVTPGKAKAIAGAAAAGGAAGVAGGAAAVHHALKDKEGSAIDQLAAEQAVYIANEGGFDPEEAGRKVAAVLELGLVAPSEKIATTATAEAAIYTRALELLEAVGYPVTWNQ
jgi:hypothetical protein